MKYKGKVLVIGGARGDDHGSILKELCPDPDKARISIITTGTSYPREAFEFYEDYFKKEKVESIDMLDIDSRYLKEEQLRLAEKSNVIFFGGGNQRKILEIIEGTELVDLIRKKLEDEEDFIAGGTSAGAMIMGKYAIGDGYDKERMIKGDVDIRDGLNLIPDTIIDTHFFQSLRMTRLSLAILEKPECIGIGLPENTGIICESEGKITAIGDEMVSVFNAGDADSNLKDAGKGDRIYAHNIRLHFLNGDSIKLPRKK
jgi:cyanophycinase